MSQSPSYEFADHVPLQPVNPGTNLLVTEPAVDGRHNAVLSLLTGAEFEGTLFLTTEQTGRETIDVFEDCGGRYTKNRMAVIDSSGDGRASPPLNIRTVGAADLLSLSLEFASLYEQLNSSEIHRVRTALYSLTPLLEQRDNFTALYRFVHTVTGRIDAAGGLGVFVIDPESHTEATVRSLEQPFDGRVDIRDVDPEADEYELEATGLDDQPTGSQPFTLPAGP